jgi:hypothetical protein
MALAPMLACSPPALAFGLKTHLWIAQQIRADVADDCRVALAGTAYAVDPDTCASLRDHPDAFYAGIVGPDAYPDLVTGQTTTHPGLDGGWQTADFMSHVLHGARPGPELAFATGYLLHGAADAMAHSYVNHYAGDIFVLGDERAVELRHVLIEKFIDARLPAYQRVAIVAPDTFVRDRLVHDPDASREYLRSGYAAHLAAMADVRHVVDGTIEDSERIERAVAEHVGRYVEAQLEWQGKLTTGEVALQAGEALLAAENQRLGQLRSGVAAARAGVDQAAAAIEANERAIVDLTTQASVQRQVIAEATNQARSLSEQYRAYQSYSNQLESNLAELTIRAAAQVCEQTYKQVCDNGDLCKFNLLCLQNCHMVAAGQVCRAVEDLGGALQRVREDLTRARDMLIGLQRQIDEAGALAASAALNEQTYLRERATRESNRAALVAARETARQALAVEAAKYETQAQVTGVAQQRVARLRQDLEATRKQFNDAKAIADRVRDLVDNLNALSAYLRLWRDGIDKAGQEYVRVADRIATGMVDGETHLFSQYQEWLACRASSYLATPYQVAAFPCDVQTEFEILEWAIQGFVEDLLPPPLDEVYGQLQALKRKVETEIKNALEKAAVELVAFVSERTTADLVDLLANPQLATEAKLNEVLASNANSGGKALLLFDRGADDIKRDIAFDGSALDPARFEALATALTLSRLALLRDVELQSLVANLGGAEATQRLVELAPDLTRSILLLSLRSIDGNQQWQPYGLPYPRADLQSQPVDPAKRHFGYGAPGDREAGFWLFQDPRLRALVFAKLFPASIQGSIMQRAELVAPAYPFPSCPSNPFPVTFVAGGAPATGDGSCP